MNDGLISLENVIEVLTENSNGASPILYRNSILSSVLKDTLGGNYQTYLIASICPDDFESEASLNTIKWASRARKISKKTQINSYWHNDIVFMLKQHIIDLKQEILTIKNKNNEYSNEEKLPELPNFNNSTRLIKFEFIFR